MKALVASRSEAADCNQHHPPFPSGGADRRFSVSTFRYKREDLSRVELLHVVIY